MKKTLVQTFDEKAFEKRKKKDLTHTNISRFQLQHVQL